MRPAAWIAIVCGASVFGCARPETPTLDVATTTSVQNSGLLNALVPEFRDAIVRVHMAGSGRALQMLDDGVVDLVISHAPEAEARYLQSHDTWTYRKIAFNRFVVVGPPSDPAGVRDAADVLDAFRRIRAASATFVSRGDESGTHERERLLWTEAGVAPDPAQLLVSGQGMAVTLRQANEREAYTLSDEATFWQLQKQLDLVALLEGDARLLNTYAVIHPQGHRAAAAFATWLASGDGRRRMSEYRIEERVAFTVWPSGCAGDTPAAAPCGAK